MLSTISYIFAAAYFLLIALALRRITGFSGRQWLLPVIFGLKVISAFLLLYIQFHYYPNHGDTWQTFMNGLATNDLAVHNKQAFWDEFKFKFTSQGLGGALSSGYASYYIMDLFQAMLSRVTLNNIYSNAILLVAINMLCFIYGWKKASGDYGAKTMLLFLLFYPSSFFQTSVLSKEWILLNGLFISIGILSSFSMGKKNMGGLLLIALTALIFIFFKTFTGLLFLLLLGLVTLLPLLPRPYYKWILLFLISGVLFFALSIFTPYNLPAIFAARQAEFLQLPANSMLPVPAINAEPFSYIISLPRSVLNAFFEPLPFRSISKLYLIFSLETLSIVFLAVYAFVHRRARPVPLPALLWALFVFAICNLLVIGYTIPNAGAIMRYRSVFIPIFWGFYFSAFPVRGIKSRLAKRTGILF